LATWGLKCARLAQFHWTYVGDTGKKYQVGLYHSTKTGHLLIHLNAKILAVDFSVRDSKEYPFFIEEEFCRIRLERRADRMYYFFDIDKEVDTPRNRARKKRNKQYLKQTLLFFGGLILLAALFGLGMDRLDRARKAEMLVPAVYLPATGQITRILDPQMGELEYQFTLPTGERYRGQKTEGNLYQHWGRMLERGDEFEVAYLKDQPAISRLDLTAPTAGQRERLRRRALDKHRRLHPEIAERELDCFVAGSVKLRQLDGLVHIFHQDQKPYANAYHNKITYRRLIKDLADSLGLSCLPPLQ